MCLKISHVAKIILFNQLHG